MFKYTIAAIEKTIDDIKFLARTFEFILAFFQIPFAIYNLAIGSGILFVNIALLVISTAYFIVYLIVSRAYSTKPPKKERKKWAAVKQKAKKISKWTKRPVQIYSFVVIIYGLTIPTTTFKPLSLILLLLQLILFIIGFVVDLLAIVIEERKNFFKEAWKADMDDFKEPGRVVGNVVKSIFGKEKTPKPQSSKTEQVLDKYIEQKETKKAQLQEQQKEEKLAKKIAKKEQKIAEKAAKKAEKQARKKVKVKALPAETELAAADELKPE